MILRQQFVATGRCLPPDDFKEEADRAMPSASARRESDPTTDLYIRLTKPKGILQDEELRYIRERRIW